MRKLILTGVLIGNVILGMINSLIFSNSIVYASIEFEEFSDLSVEAFDKKEVLQLEKEIRRMTDANDFSEEDNNILI